ncbi:MAG: penicillin-binding protein, partial [Chloroflexi bacterium]|nr:penicillin-binding protein [Chloroflexota bacterium]
MKKRKNKIKESSFLRKTLKPRILLMIALIGAGILFGIIAGILIFWYRGLPDVSILEEYEPELTTQIYDSKGRIIANLFKENRIWVPLEKIPKNLIYAVLA